MEANRFASYFLMPEKLIREHFTQRFGPRSIVLCDETAFLLFQSGLQRVKEKMKSRRAFSRSIAQATSFGSRPFVSMAAEFAVSSEAMAIRLEELHLL